MDKERDQDSSDQKTAGQQGQSSEYGQQGEESADGMGGQPIGGNDSNTGTGTTLTQGADFALDEHTTSNAGGSSVGKDQTSGGSSGVDGGKGFIGSRSDAGSDIESRRGDEGEAVHGGDQAGPNSDRAGEPIAPQTGNPHADDRRPD